MKGMVFHWDDPWRDIYSGLDPTAAAWCALMNTFGLELIAIETTWPFKCSCGIKTARSLDEVLAARPSARFALADPAPPVGVRRVLLSQVDWLVFGPSEGWRGAYADKTRWVYEPSPPGGFHALHLAHIAAHMGRGG